MSGPAAPPRREPTPSYPPGPDPIATAETAPWFPHQPDPPTDQLPRYIPDGPVHTNGRAVHDGPDPQHDEPGEPTAAGIALDDLDARDAAAFGPAVEAESADAPPTQVGRADRESAELSPATAWLAMVAQWIGGAIGGAALWVAFRYLWTAMPVVALVAAVLVIGGLVLLVRAIRRSDDLKTTVFAVLVGLVVTVSPAVLVLVTR